MATALAGVVGTGVGGLIGALLEKESNRTVSLLLSFAGGVMLSVVCCDLVIEAVETQVGIGIVMASAIALHNVPEGMTIGASYASNEGVMGSAALVLAILIGLHNIPEGMAVSVPLISGGMTKWKAVLITAATGIPTIVGALLGYLLGEIGALGLCLSLGFASGAMLYVVFGEILPQAILMYHSKLPAFSAIAGMLLGLFIIFA